MTCHFMAIAHSRMILLDNLTILIFYNKISIRYINQSIQRDKSTVWQLPRKEHFVTLCKQLTCALVVAVHGIHFELKHQRKVALVETNLQARNQSCLEDHHTCSSFESFASATAMPCIVPSSSMSASQNEVLDGLHIVNSRIVMVDVGLFSLVG